MQYAVAENGLAADLTGAPWLASAITELCLDGIQVQVYIALGRNVRMG